MYQKLNHPVYVALLGFIIGLLIDGVNANSDMLGTVKKGPKD